MDNKIKNSYPALIGLFQTASEEAIQELCILTEVFSIPSNVSEELSFHNGRRSVGLALLKLKEADLNTTLIKQHKDISRSWKTKQNLR